jgi:hypothetical protein
MSFDALVALVNKPWTIENAGHGSLELLTSEIEVSHADTLKLRELVETDVIDTPALS